MTSGGARNRSGPKKDPNSLRTEQRGVVFSALPPNGYSGKAPEFPLSPVVVMHEYFSDGEKIRERDDGASESRREREAELWSWVWTTPQAAAWVEDPWRWHAVAMWVRTAVLCESFEATAADKNSLHRFADQIGLTPAGLRENGWKIGQASDPKAVKSQPAVKKKKAGSRSRLQIVKPTG